MINTPSPRFDLCVIGAGSAGYAAAAAAHAHGRDVLVISRPGDLGGTCIRRGCMPAKSVLASTEALGRVEKAPAVGVDPGHIEVDLQAIVDRKNALVDYFVRSRTEDFADIPHRHANARFVDEAAIDVDGERIEAQRFLVATGSHIVPPAIPGLLQTGFFTSDEALDMTAVPRSLLVIGAGPVGCEFAQYFARLGCRVTLVQAEGEILRYEDPDLAAVVRAALEREGVDVRVGTRVERLERTAIGVGAVLRAGHDVRNVTAERVMLATGRRPNTAALGLERAGVLLDGDRLVVDAYLRTANHRIFAAGDVLGRRCLVHVAASAGERAEYNAFAESPKAVRLGDLEAHSVYTQPQLAVAGMTERDARAIGIEVQVARHPFSDIGKALVSDEPEGFIKMLAHPDGTIVGVGIVGAEAVDLINEGAVIVARGMSAADVVAVPHLHPTMGEIYVRVAERISAGTSADNSRAR